VEVLSVGGPARRKGDRGRPGVLRMVLLRSVAHFLLGHHGFQQIWRELSPFIRAMTSSLARPQRVIACSAQLINYRTEFFFYDKTVSAREPARHSLNSTTFVLFGKYYPIVDQLGLKNSSRDF
jgi:hypothetical protein